MVTDRAEHAQEWDTGHTPPDLGGKMPKKA
jgi:hypothetical protein